MEEYLNKEKKPAPVRRGAAAAGGLLCGLVSLILLLTVMLGTGETRSAAGTGGTPVMDRFDMAVGNEISDALDGILNLQKAYWLSDDVLTAPRPNPECAGTSRDPKELQGLLEDARDRLGVVDLIFSTEVEIEPGSEIRYYLDDTIFSVSWKQIIDSGVYSFTEVKISHPSQIRRFLAGGEFGSGVLYTATEMANSVNAVSAVSGDYYSYRPGGITVYNGEICRANGSYLDICFVDDKGDFLFSKKGELRTPEEVESYVKDHKVRFSLAFGPVILENGELVMPADYSIGEVLKRYSRAAICQQGPLHYIAVTANTSKNNPNTPDMRGFGRNLQELGIRNAYALDGGQTATMVAGGTLFNSIDYGHERLISDIIYFATAIPDGQ